MAGDGALRLSAEENFRVLGTVGVETEVFGLQWIELLVELSLQEEE